MTALRELVLLTRTDLLRLARTSEVVRYIVLPALLGPPVLLFVIVLATSMRGPRAVVAVPADLPAELDLAGGLAEARIATIVSPSPRAAWEAGEVQAAVVGWHDGEGIGAASDLELASRARWTLEVVADERWLFELLRDRARLGGQFWMEEIVALAGGDPERDLWVAQVRTPRDDDHLLPFEPARGVMAYASFLLGLVSYLFLALPLVADRAEGVTETMRALPISPARMVLSRLIAMGALQLLVLILVILNVVILLAPLANGEDFTVPGFLQMVAVAVSTLFVSGGYAAIGLHAHTVKTAGNGATLVMFSHMLLLGWALLGEPPPWVPVAGAIAATDPLPRAIGVLCSLAAAAGIVAWLGHRLRTHVELVLPRGTS